MRLGAGKQKGKHTHSHAEKSNNNKKQIHRRSCPPSFLISQIHREEKNTSDNGRKQRRRM
jgi:hypothetical protein